MSDRIGRAVRPRATLGQVLSRARFRRSIATGAVNGLVILSLLTPVLPVGTSAPPAQITDAPTPTETPTLSPTPSETQPASKTPSPSETVTPTDTETPTPPTASPTVSETPTPTETPTETPTATATPEIPVVALALEASPPFVTPGGAITITWRVEGVLPETNADAIRYLVLTVPSGWTLHEKAADFNADSGELHLPLVSEKGSVAWRVDPKAQAPFVVFARLVDQSDLPPENWSSLHVIAGLGQVSSTSGDRTTCQGSATRQNRS